MPIVMKPKPSSKDIIATVLFAHRLFLAYQTRFPRIIPNPTPVNHGIILSPFQERYCVLFIVEQNLIAFWALPIIAFTCCFRVSSFVICIAFFIYSKDVFYESR